MTFSFMDKIKDLIPWLPWPGLLTVAIALTDYGFSCGHPILYFNIAYVFMIVSLFFLERWMPHEKAWTRPDGQLFADIAHTLTSKGTVQTLLASAGAFGLAGLSEDPAHGLWPYAWPVWAQVILGLVIAEFPLYWAHYFGHKQPLWRFHAIHHSVTKLWFVNTGRFHFVDSLVKIIGSLCFLIAFGASMDVLMWISAITAFIGLLTHCNVRMRFGWLSVLFNTAELHRWHHSKDLREGDKNFCENIMIWDHVFQTYFREPWRRPPVNIGLKQDYMPPKFSHQIIWPFLPEALQGQMKLNTNPTGTRFQPTKSAGSPLY